MKGLKQTLGKEDIKKKKKNNFTTTLGKMKKTEWNQLNSIILCKSPNKTMQNSSSLEHEVASIIENSFKNKAVVSLDKVVKEIIQKCTNFQSENTSASFEDQEVKKLEQLKQLIHSIISKKQKRQEQSEAINKFYEELTQIIKKKNKVSKKEKLQEYDRLIRMLSPKTFHKKEKTSQQIPNNSIRMKVTQQQYEIKRDPSSTSLRMGSEGKRAKTSGSNHSGFKSENGHQKLKKFLSKDTSMKLIKTKIQYDYSAIFEASKSQIQSRKKNMTTNSYQKSGGSPNVTAKLNKAKKNEAFVFYRPKNRNPKIE